MMRNARIVGFAMVALAACQTPPTEPSPKGQSVQGVIDGTGVLIYLSDRPLTDAERDNVAKGTKIGIGWTLIRMPMVASSTEKDMAADSGVAYSSEWPSKDPYTYEPTTCLISLVAGESGLTGHVQTSPAEGSSVKIAYAVQFKGLKPFRSDTLEYIDYEASNDGQFVPQVMQ